MLAVIPVMSLGLFVNAFVESYWQYAALHLIYCSGTPVLWINSHTLSLEFFSSGHKKILLCAKVLQGGNSIGLKYRAKKLANKLPKSQIGKNTWGALYKKLRFET